jgi:hypothetical protein
MARQEVAVSVAKSTRESAGSEAPDQTCDRLVASFSALSVVPNLGMQRNVAPEDSCRKNFVADAQMLPGNRSSPKIQRRGRSLSPAMTVE